MGFKKTSLIAIAAAAALVAASASAQVRGVTKDEILLGSHIDLSGPIAELGRAGVNAGKMAEEEINAAGGIHGRKLRILWEDSKDAACPLRPQRMNSQRYLSYEFP